MEEEETCAGFVVTAEPVINARTTASWELESYLTWSRGFIYRKRMETSGRTHTLSNSVVRDRHYCSGLISTFSNKMILKHRQFIMLMLQIFISSVECFMSVHVSSCLAVSSDGFTMCKVFFFLYFTT